MANTFNWQLGHEGKGNVYDDGSISTWNIDRDLDPHHHQIAIDDEKGHPRFKFYISPEGGAHDGGITFENRSPYTDDQEISEIVAQHPSLWDGRNEDMTNYQSPTPRGEFGHAYNLLEAISKVSASEGWAEFHTEFKIPRGVRKQIRRWVDRMKWPEDSTKMDAREYHITVLDMDEYDEEFAKWARDQVRDKTFHFKSTKMDIFGETVVVRLECPEWDEIALEWGEKAETKGLEPHRFPGGPKAHISVGKSPGRKWPQGIPNPHVKFDTRMFNVKKNSMAWPQEVYHVSPASNRQAIEQEGLRAHERDFPTYNPTGILGTGIRGNYAFDNSEDAERYAIAHAEAQKTPMDIFKVNPNGIDIEQDPESHEIRPSQHDYRYEDPDQLDPSQFERNTEMQDLEGLHSPEYYWFRPKPIEEYDESMGPWEEQEDSMVSTPTSPIAWKMNNQVPPEQLAHHKTITPEYVDSLPKDGFGMRYDPNLPWNQAPEPYHNVWYANPEDYQNSVNNFLKAQSSSETTPAEDLKLWLDSFTPEQAQPPSLHHTDGDDFTPQIVAPVVQTPHIDPPSKPYTPYNWAEEGWEESPLDRTSVADPNFVQRWIKEHGPYMYYGANRPDLAEIGIQPSEGGYSYKWGSDAPRPGHVYLANNPQEASFYGTEPDQENPGGHLYQVDIRHLDPSRFNPNENDFESYWNPDEYETIGEWAEDQSLGDNPDETHESFAKGGPIYKGMIPPEAVTKITGHTASIDTHICPKCGEDSNSPICATCGYDPQNSPDDYQQMKDDWYDRAWSVPGNQPRPVPNQPMHWRDDHAKNVSLAHNNQDNSKELGGWHGF